MEIISEFMKRRRRAPYWDPAKSLIDFFSSNSQIAAAALLNFKRLKQRFEIAFAKALASQDLINVQLYYLTHMYQKQEIVNIIQTHMGNIDRDKPEREIVVKDSKTLS